MKTLLNSLVLISALWLTAMPHAQANLQFEALDSLPPAEQYRQLSIMLMVAGAAAPGLVDALLEPGVEDAANAPRFDPDAYRTPLTRIVDQDSMLQGSATMFRFTREHFEAVSERLQTLENAYPEAILGLDMNAVTEDAILIRQAIADSIDYSGLGSREDIAPLLQTYRNGTVRLRNILEYEQFSRELDQLTAEAIDSVGGKLDAYQRMFDDELGITSFDKHIDAAEYIYTKDFDQRAGDMTEDIIKNMVLLESQPNR